MEKIGNIMINYINILNECNVLGNNLISLLQVLFTIIKICIPILCVILISIDVVSMVISDNTKNGRDVLNKSIKRLVVGVVIFFIPTLVNLILNMSGYITGTCGIG